MKNVCLIKPVPNEISLSEFVLEISICFLGITWCVRTVGRIKFSHTPESTHRTRIPRRTQTRTHVDCFSAFSEFTMFSKRFIVPTHCLQKHARFIPVFAEAVIFLYDLDPDLVLGSRPLRILCAGGDARLPFSPCRLFPLGPGTRSRTSVSVVADSLAAAALCFIYIAVYQSALVLLSETSDRAAIVLGRLDSRSRPIETIYHHRRTVSRRFSSFRAIRNYNTLPGFAASREMKQYNVLYCGEIY